MERTFYVTVRLAGRCGHVVHKIPCHGIPQHALLNQVVGATVPCVKVVGKDTTYVFNMKKVAYFKIEEGEEDGE